MNIYTKTGDAGETSLPSGLRVSKDDARLSICGEVDELNTVLGWCRAANGAANLVPRIKQIQRDMLSIGSELAAVTPEGEGGSAARLESDACRRLEDWIDEATSKTGSFGGFVLPGGGEPACRLDLARVVCRRLERGIVSLSRAYPVSGDVLAYLNRLSDLLFVWARYVNSIAGNPEEHWKSQK